MATSALISYILFKGLGLEINIVFKGLKYYVGTTFCISGYEVTKKYFDVFLKNSKIKFLLASLKLIFIFENLFGESLRQFGSEKACKKPSVILKNYTGSRL
jgi:hypothetical protein